MSVWELEVICIILFDALWWNESSTAFFSLKFKLHTQSTTMFYNGLLIKQKHVHEVSVGKFSLL